MIIVPNLDSNEVSINWINDVKCKRSDLLYFSIILLNILI